MTAAVVKAPATLYRPGGRGPVAREPARATRSAPAAATSSVRNPPGGGQIYYSLTRKADDSACAC